VTIFPKGLLVTASIPLAVAIGALFFAIVGPSRSTPTLGAAPPIGNGQVSVLSRAATSADQLPRQVLDTPFASHYADPAATRLAATHGSEDIFVTPGTGGTLCLIEWDVADQTSASSCADQQLLNTGSIFLSSPNPDGTTSVVGVLADGYTSVQAPNVAVNVRNNVFALDQMQGTKLTLVRQNGRKQAQNLGAQRPPK
jgi:hypothetical protein